VLLYNSRLGVMEGKLRSKLIGPFVVTNVYPMVHLRSKANPPVRASKWMGIVWSYSSVILPWWILL